MTLVSTRMVVGRMVLSRQKSGYVLTVAQTIFLSVLDVKCKRKDEPKWGKGIQISIQEFLLLFS